MAQEQRLSSSSSSSSPSSSEIAFGQTAILKVLLGLGGRATLQEISAKAVRYYPTYSKAIRDKTVGLKLAKLKKWEYVRHVKDENTKQWYWVSQAQKSARA